MYDVAYDKVLLSLFPLYSVQNKKAMQWNWTTFFFCLLLWKLPGRCVVIDFRAQWIAIYAHISMILSFMSAYFTCECKQTFRYLMFAVVWWMNDNPIWPVRRTLLVRKPFTAITTTAATIKNNQWHNLRIVIKVENEVSRKIEIRIRHVTNEHGVYGVHCTHQNNVH